MTWKMATFNVNGLRARLADLMDWIDTARPDCLCLQETKCPDSDFPQSPFQERGYQPYFRGQKAYNGVAVLVREEPQAVRLSFDDGQPDEEARFIAAQTHGIWVINTYVPQGRTVDHPAFEQKLDFFRRVKRYLGRHDPGEPLIWTGDLNVAPEPLDVYDPLRLEGEVGFHPREREELKDVAAWGLTDLFRRLHPDRKQFSFWDYRLPSALKRGLGWRLDHIWVTEPLVRTALSSDVDAEPRTRPKPSDHAPVWAEFNWE
jgi:exodeoxyribonuclease-3